MLKIWFAQVYSAVFGWFHDYCGINIRGLGFVLRSLDRDYIIAMPEGPFYFNHKAATCYARLLGKRFNEQETHTFMGNVVAYFGKPLTFINVGANIGEMIFTMARLEQVDKVYAVEPQQECLKVCAVNNLLNGFTNVTLLQQVVSDKEEDVLFESDSSPQSKIIAHVSGRKTACSVKATTLDKLFPDIRTPIILLIDVEGAELKVLRGGFNLIKRNKPLIIFEYNRDTEKVFSLNEVRDLLGNEYELLKLNNSGRLEQALNNTWNIVAVHTASGLFKACQQNLV